MEICNETQYLAAAQSIFEHAHLPVLVCDKKMLILWHNSCAEVYIHGLTGYPSAAGLLPTGDLGSILAQLQKGLDVYLPSPQLPAGGSPLQLHLIPVLGAQGQLQLVTLMLPVASGSLTEGSAGRSTGSAPLFRPPAAPISPPSSRPSRPWPASSRSTPTTRGKKCSTRSTAAPIACCGWEKI